MIEVVESGGVFEVTVRQGAAESTHRVTVPETFLPGADRIELVRSSFAFLLDREPASSILPAFALPQIERYFPDYPEWIGSKVSRPGSAP